MPPDLALTVAIFLRHRRPVRRRPGSAVDFAELSKRVTLKELKAERARILKRPIERIRRFAKRHGMSVKAVDVLGRCVYLRATAAKVERVFSTRLLWFDDVGERRHYPHRAPRLPRQLADIARTVIGLDTRKPRLSRLRQNAIAGGTAGLFPSEIADLYGIRTAGRGAGQCIAIIEPSGGYAREDVAKACDAMKVPVPKIVDIKVGDGRNAPGANPKADMEVALDIQVVAGVAPEARIAVYFAELSEPGLVAAVSKAVYSRTARPNVIVITWGQPEARWPPESREAMDAVLQDAFRLGITVVTTAGDDLAWEHVDPNQVCVNYPASSPYVLGCGGTQIALDATGTAIVDEVVWNENGRRGTGGGISQFYMVPPFQSGARLPGSLNDGKPGRGVPDVAAAAAAFNGYRIFLNGAEVVASGTSAVAPLWAALIALVNAERGKALGFVNSRLYQAPDLLKPIISGNNIDAETGLGYAAGPDPGWNACTGLGSPKGAAIIAAWTAAT